jgi:hypothetical protein
MDTDGRKIQRNEEVGRDVFNCAFRVRKVENAASTEVDLCSVADGPVCVTRALARGSEHGDAPC